MKCACICLVGFIRGNCETGASLLCFYNVLFYGSYKLITSQTHGPERVRVRKKWYRIAHRFCLMKLPLFLSLLYRIFIVIIFLQTLTTVLITHAVMVDLVKMVSTVIPVTAREDIQEITVKQVSCCPCGHIFECTSLNAKCFNYACNMHVPQHAPGYTYTLRPRPHVSEYFLIRHFFSGYGFRPHASGEFGSES